MPIIEILLFGVGVGIGGKRAWRKLTGQEEEEEDDDDDAPAHELPASPGRSPPASPRRK
jgi:hypothetical protein